MENNYYDTLIKQLQIQKQEYKEKYISLLNENQTLLTKIIELNEKIEKLKNKKENK